jgi:glc operon protein GlcG
MIRLTRAAMLVAAAVAAVGPAGAQPAPRPQLTLDGARRVVEAAVAEARRDGAGGTVAVVDDGGHVIAVERLDGTFPASGPIAIGKARTAALFRRPTRAFEDVIAGGRTAMVALPDFTPLQGGIPIAMGDHVVGAIGVSGAASAQRDEAIAAAGAAAARTLAAGPAGRPVTHLDRAAVAAAFARGVPLLEVDGYKVHASRRDAPGVPEVHDRETDVVYVLDGAATLVVGGTVVDPVVTEPGQVRGRAIAGGERRRVRAGDVLVIPAGVPHWFQEVPGPLTYFVVKPIAPGGAAR